MTSMRRFKRPKPATLVLCAVLGGVLVGCGTETQAGGSAGRTAAPPASTPGLSAFPSPTGPSSTPQPRVIDEPVLGDIPKISDSGKIPMPLDPYMSSMRDLKTIDVAQEAAAADCMRALGYTGWTANMLRTWDEESYKEFDFFEYIDPEEAARSGYPKPPADSTLKMTDGEKAPKKSPTSREVEAFEGIRTGTTTDRAVPQGGCLGEGQRKVRDEALPVDARSLAVDSRRSAMQDSRVKAALDSWRSCMQKNGLQHQDPVILRLNPLWVSRKAGTPADDRERHTAAVDARCQQEVNIVGVYKTVRAAYETRLVDANKSKLIQKNAIFEGWVRNAESILAGR